MPCCLAAIRSTLALQTQTRLNRRTPLHGGIVFVPTRLLHAAVIAEAQPQPLTAPNNSVTINEIGERHVVPSLDAAIAGRPSHVTSMRVIE